VEVLTAAATEPGRKLFDPRLVLGLIAAGIVAFVLYLILLAYGGDFRSGRDGRPHALSNSAVGFGGVVRLVGLSGGTANMVRAPTELETEDLVVAAIELRVSPEALTQFIEQRGARATLLILPKWEVMPHEGQPGWVRSIGRINPDDYRELLAPLGTPTISLERTKQTRVSGRDFLDGFAAPAPGIAQTVSGKALTPLLVTTRGSPILVKVGEGPLYLLADPDLLNNKGLNDPGKARAALALLDALNSTEAQTVAFDLTLNGFERRPNLLKLAFEPPFLALTLAIFVAALLAGVHGAFRFGPEAAERRAIAFGKSALVENSAALMKIARREHRAGGAYAQLVRDWAARSAGAHLAVPDAELDAYLDRLSPTSGQSFSELAARAAEARDSHDLVAAARALFQWKKDLIK
jgi:hypothetical protein